MDWFHFFLPEIVVLKERRKDKEHRCIFKHFQPIKIGG